MVTSGRNTNATPAQSPIVGSNFCGHHTSTMKYFSTAIILLFSLTYSMGQNKSQTSYIINGKLKNWKGRLIYLSFKGIGNDRIWDSAVVNDDTFKFAGTLNEPSNGFITTLKFDRVNNLADKNITERLFFSPSQMTISLVLDSFQNAKLIGSKYQIEYQKLQTSKLKFHNKIKLLNEFSDRLIAVHLKLSSENKELEKKYLERKLDSIITIKDSFQQKCSMLDKAFFTKNPNSYVTSYLLQYYYSSLSLKDLKYYYYKMLPKHQRWEYGIKLKKAISGLENGSPGNIAIGFTQTDINGDSLSLLQFKGKYILLDFWASWCKPCRAENPELIELYKKYKSKGIEFIGIADDIKSEDKWKLAVENDGIKIWRHILDKKIGTNYAVHTIPLQILIDPNGLIIGRFGEGAEPNENISIRLEKIFGKENCYQQWVLCKCGLKL